MTQAISEPWILSAGAIQKRLGVPAGLSAIVYHISLLHRPCSHYESISFLVELCDIRY